MTIRQKCWKKFILNQEEISMKEKLKMIWRIIRDRQVVLITEDHGRMYYD